MNKFYNGLQIISSEHVPIEYKTQKITYHNPIYTPKRIKKWKYNITEYLKKTPKSYSSFVMGDKVIMHPVVLEKMIKAGLI